MLRNTVVNTVTFFYPIGNTPAVCLTQNLAPEQDASVLLLGCGDARNILFTTYTDPERRLDVTCCDIESYILARNILLFTLLIDDTQNQRSECIWNIYYHLNLDDQSLELLESQSEKLVQLTADLEQWNASQYGSTIRFCNQRTFEMVKNTWKTYYSKNVSPKEKSAWLERLKNASDRAKDFKKIYIPDGGHVLSGIRSAAPASIAALDDISRMYDQFWNTGTVDFGSSASKATHRNPTFLSSPNESLILHYGLDPLLGFHLAAAYVPLTPESALHIRNEVMRSSINIMVETARLQFNKWGECFRRAAQKNVVVRFCVADAIAFCHTLQHARASSSFGNANLACDNWTFQPLVLDSVDYVTGQAPTQFDIVDTSNLIDHLGSLNIIVATAPLLVPKPSSALYCEVLVQSETNIERRMQALLCGDFETVLLLLGLTCVDSWTNATMISDVDEGMANAHMVNAEVVAIGGASQVRTRLCFNRLDQMPPTANPLYDAYTAETLPIEIKPENLAKLLHSIYSVMFCSDDVMNILENIQLHGLSKMTNPYYNRLSFVAVLKHVRSHILSDWNQTLVLFLNSIEQGIGRFSAGHYYVQELFLYLHLLGIHTVRSLDADVIGRTRVSASSPFSAWKIIPPVVCITILLPQEKLRTITALPLANRGGTPTIRCTIQAPRTALRQWANDFCAIQTGFGQIRIDGDHGTQNARIEVDEDPSCWTGTSPLIVSFLVPSWMLLLEHSNTLVACGILSTPQSAMALGTKLGMELNLFETSLGDSRNVHVTNFMPNMRAYPNFVAGAKKTLVRQDSRSAEDFRHSTLVILSPNDSRISNIARKIEFISQVSRTKLAEKSSVVEVKFQSPMAAELTIGGTLSCNVIFPVPVNGYKNKLRIARKSGYVELITPVLHALENSIYPFFIFPACIVPSTERQKVAYPVLWNMPYTNLAVMPDIDTKIPEKIEWIITHTSLAFSTRERKMREAGIAKKLPQGMKQDLRVELKEGMFSMFMHYTGLQGERTQVFGLTKADSGVHVLFLASSLKLDVANHTVMLDTAVIPLTSGFFLDKKLRSFLAAPHFAHLCQINVTSDELRLWKTILPALVERCRTWVHKASCEYTLKGAIPDAGSLDDEETPLCSCGLGTFPPGYLENSKLPHMKHVLDKYATRAVISPIFCVPYIEECFLKDVPRSELNPYSPSGSSGNGNEKCLACGAEKKKASGGDAVEALMVCSRCKKAKYCSAECQKAHWKTHKPTCVAA